MAIANRTNQICMTESATTHMNQGAELRPYPFRMRFGQQKDLDKDAMASCGGTSVLVEPTGLFYMS